MENEIMIQQQEVALVFLFRGVLVPAFLCPIVHIVCLIVVQKVFPFLGIVKDEVTTWIKFMDISHHVHLKLS